MDRGNTFMFGSMRDGVYRDGFGKERDVSSVGKGVFEFLECVVR